MLTVKELDYIVDRLESKVLSKYSKEEQTFIWALYGWLLQHMKDKDISIDEALTLYELENIDSHVRQFVTHNNLLDVCEVILE